MAEPSNLLQHETSPYLLQHAGNPVHWRPWGRSALAAAQAADKPILLSIGYAACHWCHVMAHESFENPAIAAQMNANFINIKVDREERPDLDAIYQNALALMGEHGGWPLTMFLTPAGEPFWGGTYFPPEPRWGRPGFPQVLSAIVEAYRNKRADVATNVAALSEGLKRLEQPQSGDGIAPELFDKIAERLLREVDPLNGGIGTAPKFPQCGIFELLWRGWKRSRREPYREAVIRTLTTISQGGIYDHLGGGYARYATDAHWLVPHFEKMLYDNAELIVLASETWQMTREPTLERVVRETIAYMERDLRAPEGGFYTAEDADSEGVEGKFYVWTPDEVRAAVGAAGIDVQAAEVFMRCFDVTAGGNWNDPHGHGPENASILHVVDRPRSADEERMIADVKSVLLAERAKRVRPGLDDKVLAGNNGMAIAALAEAGRIFGDHAFVDGARRTAESALAHTTEGSRGRLLRTFKAGAAKLPGTLDDHAHVADGLLALYEATGEARWLEEAHRLTRLSIGLFWDGREHCFYMTAADDPGLVQRPVSTFDSAVPSGMSVTIENLIRLGDICGERNWLAIAEAALHAHYDRALENPFGFSNMLNALDLYLERPTEIVLAGGDVTPFMRAIASVYLPNRMIVRADSAPPLVSSLVNGKT